jgi:hypothetical protein
MTIRAIETSYRGCRFRSRLEARWAVFFQTLGVRWEYEPEGFVLSTGQWYLPDFRVRLADRLLWAEVKPEGMDAPLFDRFIADCGTADPSIGDPIFTVLSEIPDPDATYSAEFSVAFNAETGGECYEFCVCGICGAVGFEFNGFSDRIGCDCKQEGRGFTSAGEDRVLNAFAAARSARFEHGERSRFTTRPAARRFRSRLVVARDRPAYTVEEVMAGLPEPKTDC